MGESALKIHMKGFKSASVFTSGSQNPTTIHIYELNNVAILITCGIFAVMLFFLIISKGKKSRSLKIPSPLLYYLSKTSYKQEHAELSKALIDRENYDVNYAQPEAGLSLFLCACIGGSADLLAYMLTKGADVQSLSNFGDSGFYLAVYEYLNSKVLDLKVLNLLLDAGCDVNHQNDNGFTALHLACSEGNLDLVQFLLLNGADPLITTYNGILPHDMAFNEGHTEVARYVMSKIRR
ncbi:cortactin-binding protein 2-like isoform X2 [Stegodyphus dumicola]|uniref:cortactin-binding protein 2-like isoform X2 n=2 Tax=Stegodyphus dumicola TaxID=202533 RepID=UPI0015B0383C|nr:cortactin-binding protein 2-like isoform X2 [Stegodyphus dumicola]